MDVSSPTMDRVNPSIWWVLCRVAWGQKIAVIVRTHFSHQAPTNE